MEENQRRTVFADLDPKPKPASADGAVLPEEAKEFHRQSLARRYCAPFNVNSKNYRHIPDKTRE